ncbi:hypothetical protein EV421DRAFT_1795245 [Armillaria borealis]|uniref:Secreted protein n=1 Tax=Armillaria borealis TaxID=47425 RepID=A0AA39MTQ6_9AGAR|nr:hypothetical protein EV421DRAFT_1795245 [Armillaria borealis]
MKGRNGTVCTVCCMIQIYLALSRLSLAGAAYMRSGHSELRSLLRERLLLFLRGREAIVCVYRYTGSLRMGPRISFSHLQRIAIRAQPGYMRLYFPLSPHIVWPKLVQGCPCGSYPETRSLSSLPTQCYVC